LGWCGLGGGVGQGGRNVRADVGAGSACPAM
jgi:hypothetical protein